MLIINLLSTVLPTFYNYKTSFRLTFTLRTGCCSSGRHAKRWRHSNRHHAWWYGSQQNKYNNNEDSPRKKHCRQRGLFSKRSEKFAERSICFKTLILSLYHPTCLSSAMACTMKLSHLMADFHHNHH
jgi:hypothetical protein